MRPTDTSFIFILVYLQLCLLVHVLDAVKGCITFEDNSDLEALCDDSSKNFSIIPIGLSSDLVKLTVNHQMIKTLDSSQFSNLRSLRVLNLDYNGLRRIEPKTFHRLKYLRVLSLRNNQLTLSQSSFGSLSELELLSLEKLDLSHNPIGFVPNIHFASNTLKELRLSSTKKDFSIEPNGFDKLYNLETLDLSYSHLVTLPVETRKSLTKMKLKCLVLHGNPWMCDFRILWLKEWYDEIYFFNPERSCSLEENVDPQCDQPARLANRKLFGTGPNSLKLLDLKVSSEIFTLDNSAKVIQGGNITFNCDCYSDPPAIVNWYKNGVPVNPARDKRLYIEQSSGASFKATLTIYSIAMSDEGEWKCVIEDVERPKEAKFKLIVDYNSDLDTSSIYAHLMNMDSTLIMKYVGLSVACFILLILIISLIIYCYYDKTNKKSLNENKTAKTTYEYNKNDFNRINKIQNDNSFDEYTQMPTNIVQTTDNGNIMTLCPISDQNFFLTSADGTEANFNDLVTLRVLPTNSATPTNDSDIANLQPITFLPADSFIFNEDVSQTMQAEHLTTFSGCPLHGSYTMQRNDETSRSNTIKSMKPLTSTAV